MVMFEQRSKEFRSEELESTGEETAILRTLGMFLFSMN